VAPGLNIQYFTSFIELELVETPHVEHQTVFGERLAAHAVALSGDRHF
jgi:hypothetical protein